MNGDERSENPEGSPQSESKGILREVTFGDPQAEGIIMTTLDNAVKLHPRHARQQCR